MAEILVGCEESGAVRDAFIALGHEALSSDLLPTRSPGPHYQGDVFNVIDYPWDMGLFYFPCTESSVSGARHFQAKRMDGRFYAGNALWMKGWRRAAHIKAVCFEHPVSVISSLFRKPDQIVQPWNFGHFETKATCLWLRGLDPLKPTYRTVEECCEALGLPAGTKPADRVHKMAPGPNRARDRSATFAGIAQAKAIQWGGDIRTTQPAPAPNASEE